jgi:RimJ/RimL family protein N-acetyltransferase
VQALVSAIVEHTMCSQIRATVDRRNIPSERLLLRLGFDAIEATRTVFRGEECVEVSYARNTERPRGSP